MEIPAGAPVDEYETKLVYRNKKTGEIIQDLRPESNRNGSREIPVASGYAAEQVFVIEE